jgi:hypothetical protein
VTEQERTQAVAAVDLHDHQAEQARLAAERAADKVAKLRSHLDTAEADAERLRAVADEEAATARSARELAEQVLADGPVFITGVEVRALAGVAVVASEGKGRTN